MKTKALAVVFTFIACAAIAQETPVANPDFSRDKLMKILSAEEPRPPRQRRIKHSFGSIEFRAWGMDWRIGYLPIMMPLAGSRRTTSKEWPDAFTLTGTEFASPPRTWRRQRAINSELRRIERLERERAKVRVER